MFKELVHNTSPILLHLPQFMYQRYPKEIIETEKEIYRKQALNEGNQNLLLKIADGKLKNIMKKMSSCQPYVKDNDKTVGDLVREAP